jgi:hypothetical protein
VFRELGVSEAALQKLPRPGCCLTVTFEEAAANQGSPRVRRTDRSAILGETISRSKRDRRKSTGPLL